MSEFEDVVNSAVAEQEAERKKESDAYQDKINREINAARDCVQALVDTFASDKRFGGYFQSNGDPHAQTRGQRFEFTMAGKTIMLHFAGNVHDLENDPAGLGITVRMKVYDPQSAVPPAGPESPVKCDIKGDNSCVPVELYETVLAAALAFIKA
ncbi:MAG TPA: hypothetical protein VII69_14420 [Candidatus Eremiobacteraceae bacterium]